MIVAKIYVDGVKAVPIKVSRITKGLQGAQIEVGYSQEWESLNKTVVIAGAVVKDVINAGSIITIPPEVTEKARVRLTVGFYGVDADHGIVIPTLWADLGVVQDGADPSGDTSTDPALPVWAQIQDMIGNLGDLSTEAKRSLVAAINELDEKTAPEETDPTVPEWAKQPEKPRYTAEEVGALSPDDLQTGLDQALEQAKESGLFDGEPGPKGDPFTYEDFTEEQLASLKGEPGKDGYTPAKRVDYPEIKVTHMAYPRKGIKIECQYERPDGTLYIEGGTVYDGEDGKDGTDGKSAYQYAQDGGYTGTEEEFAEKLASELGDPDWNAAEGEPGHVLNRTHYTENVPNWLVEDAGITISSGIGASVDWINYATMQGCDLARVIFDGVTYNLPVNWFVDPYMDGDSNCQIGNFLGSAPEIPFGIICYKGSAGYGTVSFFGSVGTHTVSFAKMSEVVHKLDKKFIPDDVGGTAQEPLVVTVTMTDEAAGNASHTAAEINAAYTSGRQVVAQMPFLDTLTLIVPLLASSDVMCVFASCALFNDTPTILMLNVYDNGAAMRTMQGIDMPDRLPNPWSLWIGDQKYDGSAYVDITDTVNSMIDAKLGVIENGTY